MGLGLSLKWHGFGKNRLVFAGMPPECHGLGVKYWITWVLL